MTRREIVDGGEDAVLRIQRVNLSAGIQSN